MTIMNYSKYTVVALGMLVCGVRLPAAEPGPMVLWSDTPAAQWHSAHPLGNGRLGAMVHGGVAEECIQLNEDTLWAGGPYDAANPGAREALPEARRLIFEGRYKEAEAFIGRTMMARPLRQMPYQTVGELRLSFPGHDAVSGYRRALDLDTAIATVSYTHEGVTHTREALASPVDQVIVVHLTADQPGRIAFTAALTTPQEAAVSAGEDGTLVMNGRNGAFSGVPGALRFQARVRIRTQGGTISTENDRVTVRGADSATLLISAATSFKSHDDVSGDPGAAASAHLAGAAAKSYAELRRAHVAEHQRLFRRVQLDLGGGPAPDLPIDQRLALFAEGRDPQLAALFFQFGRYLLMCSSRPGTQPANLQGIWNDKMAPPWESKYTININIQMNYWIAESANLSECAEPLIRMVEEIAQTGRRTAEENWGAGGWVCHHNTDLWRATGPIDAPWWGMWPVGGAWLCQHLWEHYEFNGDRKFLERMYPTFKEASQFFLDTLVEDPKSGRLVTCPSLSPENAHPFATSICAGPEVDMQILRDLFHQTIRAAEILDRDAPFREQVAAARDRLAPPRIGHAGQLQEWMEDWDLKAPNIHFGHMSHLYAVYPSLQFSPRTTPELWAAARKSLEIRGPMGGGWPAAWQICLWARMGDGGKAYQQLTALMNPRRTAPNLVVSPSHFQLDANFGGAAGILEMLLQSRDGEIDLLPALPAGWPAGKVSGLRARGGFTVDMEWEDGRVTRYKITSGEPRTVKVRMNGEMKSVTTAEDWRIVAAHRRAAGG